LTLCYQAEEKAEKLARSVMGEAVVNRAGGRAAYESPHLRRCSQCWRELRDSVTPRVRFLASVLFSTFSRFRLTPVRFNSGSIQCSPSTRSYCWKTSGSVPCQCSTTCSYCWKTSGSVPCQCSTSTTSTYSSSVLHQCSTSTLRQRLHHGGC
jgi:hypothetical protein